MIRRFLLGAGAALIMGQASAQTEGYYTEPAFNAETLVFSSEGDLWRAPVSGGLALRLTTHPEVETNPVLSPDGKWVAFEASYDGPTEIYVMPITGGTPKRVTYEGGGVAMRGWKDDTTLIYRTGNIPGTISRLLRTVNTGTLEITDIPVADADLETLSADGKTLFFTRYGLSMFSDNAVQYRGGRMAQFWAYTLGSDEEATHLAADFGAPIRDPMFWQDRIYFVSDKSGSDNIWSMDEAGGDLRQHTQSTQWQMRTPYLSDGRIAYQSGADIYVYDIASGQTAQIALTLMSDDDYARNRWLGSPLQYLEAANLAPDGESVTLTARGKFATGFTGSRRRVEYQIPEGARVRSAIEDKSGDWVYALVDQGRSSALWRFPADGSGKGEAVYGLDDSYVWYIWTTPDENELLWSDKKGRLFLFDIEKKTTKLLDQTMSSSDQAFGDFSWSSDGRYLAYGLLDSRDILQIAILDTETSKKTILTSGKYESFSPVFSADNKWLYFISNRHFDASPSSPWGDRNMGPEFTKRGKIYALQLDPKAEFPFAEPDELTADKDDDEAEDKEDDKKDDDADSEKAEVVKITFDGLASRLWEVPVGNGNFSALAATEGHLFVLDGGGSELYWSGESDASMKRISFTWDDPKASGYFDDVSGFQFSGDKSTLFVQKGRGESAKFYLIDPSKDVPSDLSSKQVRFSDWKMMIDPRDEWQQLAQDTWRLHRDFSFDPNLRAVDWNAVGDHFLPFADRIGHRSELNDLQAQMSAELGILHSQIRSGDEPSDTESGAPAFLGATYKPVEKGLQIETIWQGERDRPDTLGPLLQPGMDVEVGDVLTAIDGVPVERLQDIANALEMKAGEQVLISYMRGKAEMQAIVEPVGSWPENLLRYRHWVELNREKVAEVSDGEIGYLHLRAMGGSDVESFVRDFYEHYDKQGLIIDVRGNRGGNIDSWIIGTLLKQAWAFWDSRPGGPRFSNMQQAFRGHIAVIIDEGTYSDGETFSAGMKALGLAPLIGTRTAGAGIWLSDRNRLSDGGQARVAEFPQFGIDGRWLVEGYGVAPDIVAETAPHAKYQGEDAQLAAAISWLEDKIAEEPIPDMIPEAISPVGVPGKDIK